MSMFGKLIKKFVPKPVRRVNPFAKAASRGISFRSLAGSRAQALSQVGIKSPATQARVIATGQAVTGLVAGIVVPKIGADIFSGLAGYSNVLSRERSVSAPGGDDIQGRYFNEYESGGGYRLGPVSPDWRWASQSIYAEQARAEPGNAYAGVYGGWSVPSVWSGGRSPAWRTPATYW